MPGYSKIVSGLPSTVPFVGPETQERARKRPFKARLGANENVFGPSPKAIAAMQAVCSDVWMYGDPENFDLRNALADHLGVNPGNIEVGEGIDGLLGYLCRMMVEPGDKVVTSDGAYPTFNYHVTGFGGDIVTVPYRNDFEDPDALIKLAQQVRPKLMYLANPDNPMGTVHDATTIQHLIDRVPEGVLLVLDEAYVECAPSGSAPLFDPENRNVVRMRTFSKAYGLAGARVGYAVGHKELISSFGKIRNHFGMCRMAQTGALEALCDPEHLAATLIKIAKARQQICQIAASNGLVALESATNFVAIDCGQDGAFARKVVDGLIARDFFVRMPFAVPQDRCIRVSAGTDENLALFAKLLPQVLAEIRG